MQLPLHSLVFSKSNEFCYILKTMKLLVIAFVMELHVQTNVYKPFIVFGLCQ